jgi:hypothetical protein
MKQAQWIAAVVALAAVVFVVTFAMQYLGSGRRASSGKGGGPVQQGRTLTFPLGTQMPSKDEIQQAESAQGSMPFVEAEAKKLGHWDFWFHNGNDEELKVGLNRVGCKRCTYFQVFVLPDGPRRPALLMGGMAGLSGAGPLAAAGYATAGFQALADKVEPKELYVTKEATYDVPAGAIGWMRLGWKDHEGGSGPVSANLWTGEEKDENVTALWALVAFLKPVRAQQMVMVQPKEYSLLPETIEFAAWSSTRSSLRVKAKLVPEHGSPEADPFKVGTPVPMSAEEMAKLERDNNQAEGPVDTKGRVLCGYKIPLTLRQVSPNGKTPIDLGPYRRYVELTLEGSDEEPVRVEVRGRVRGVVDVPDEQVAGGGLDLGTFPRSQGSGVRDVALQSSVAGLDLKLDRKRTPKFLDARLEGPDDPKAARRAWTLKIAVKPDAISGSFPRPDDPAHEDCAVHLTATKQGKKGEPPQRIRIPVRGQSLDQ